MRGAGTIVNSYHITGGYGDRGGGNDGMVTQEDTIFVSGMDRSFTIFQLLLLKFSRDLPFALLLQSLEHSVLLTKKYLSRMFNLEYLN